jgi:hypothetical protein
MQITLRYFDGCPNWRLAEARMNEALAAVVRPQPLGRLLGEQPHDAGVREPAHRSRTSRTPTPSTCAS